MSTENKKRKPVGGRLKDRAWREANRERLIEYQKQRYHANPELHREISRKRYRANRESALAYMKARYLANPEHFKAMCRERRAALRANVFTLLGNKCVCCGETEPHFLEVDHINGGGNKHYTAKGTWGVLREVRDHPERAKVYRLLCSNCNKARSRIGYCPHNNGI